MKPATGNIAVQTSEIKKNGNVHDTTLSILRFKRGDKDRSDGEISVRRKHKLEI